MPLVIVAIGVALLLLLMIRFKMNGFIALVLVALAVGLMQGMPLDKVIVSIKNGVIFCFQFVFSANCSMIAHPFLLSNPHSYPKKRASADLPYHPQMLFSAFKNIIQ